MLNQEFIKYRITLAKFSAGVLFFAIVPIWPYVFYQILKLVVFGSACFLAYTYHKENKTNWMWYMIIVAIIFNPINALYFGHFLWSIVDLVVAIMFLKAPKDHHHIS
jgi:hypothetical protein